MSSEPIIFSEFEGEFDDESDAVQKMPLYRLPQFAEALKRQAVDEIAGSNGEYGRSINNPIPANGMLGSMVYLNRLICPCGEHILFHRIGSTRSYLLNEVVDRYETVCYNGHCWDNLYFASYFPRRARKLPLGYSASEFIWETAGAPNGLGTDFKVPSFPFDMEETFAIRFEGEAYEEFVPEMLERYKHITSEREKFLRINQRELDPLLLPIENSIPRPVLELAMQEYYTNNEEVFYGIDISYDNERFFYQWVYRGDWVKSADLPKLNRVLHCTTEGKVINLIILSGGKNSFEEDQWLVKRDFFEFRILTKNGELQSWDVVVNSENK